MLRTYKYRLYPNVTQGNALEAQLTTHRYLYNSALEQRINTYKETQKGLKYGEQSAKLKELRVENEYLAKCNFSSLQHTLRKLDKTYSAFFRRIKHGEKAGFPRFKNKIRFNSIEYTYSDGCIVKDRKLRIQNIGSISIRLHRDLPENSTIKHVVIKRELNKWYVCLMLDIPEVIRKRTNAPDIGIDVGIKHLVTLSDGTVFDSPKHLNNSLKELRRKQRRLARRKKGSNGRKKAAFQVARLNNKISNQRADFAHKTTKKIADNYGNIYLEKLPLNFMIQNKHLARHTVDVAIGQFRQMLEYKAEYAGNQVIYVNPKNTSQKCSECGKLVPKTLSVRIHNCPFCGFVSDRDINASLNILQLGMSCEAITRANGLFVASEAVCFS